MAYLVLLLAVLLGGCGGYVLYLGFDDLVTERGFAYTMSGTVAFSTALLLLAVGFGLIWLGRLARRLDRIAMLLEPFSAPQSIEGEAAPQAASAIPEAAVLGAVEDAILADIEVPATSSRPKVGLGSYGRGAAAVGAAAAGVVVYEAGRAGIEPEDRGAPSRPERTSSEPTSSEPAASEPTGYQPALHEPAAQPREDAGPREDATPRESADAPSFASTHAEIDRLLDELSVGDPFAPAGTRHTPALSPIPPEPSIYREAVDEAAEAPVPEAPAASEAEADVDFLEPVESEPIDLEPVLVAERGEPDAGEAALHGAEAHPAAGHDGGHPDVARGEEDEREQAESSEDSDLAHLDPVPSAPTDDLREAAHRAEEPAPEREVVGSYESAGVTYTLFADGGVIAQSEAAREEYPSLEALRHAFEQGESVFSA